MTDKEDDMAGYKWNGWRHCCLPLLFGGYIIRKMSKNASVSKNYKNISNEQIDSALLFQYD